jgi:acetyl esterase/lipase
MRLLMQAISTVHSLHNVLMISPQIITGGDSAGANLALGVISVLLHSLEGIQPLRITAPLAGILLISPWVSFSTESQSFVKNANRDVIPEEIVHQLGRTTSPNPSGLMSYGGETFPPRPS